MSRLILASTSPRRHELLQFLGVEFDVRASEFPEERVKFEDFDSPDAYVMTIAMGKALAVADQEPDALILSADTMVFCDGKPYGKPRDLDDARAMLAALRGKTHTVLTALVVLDRLTGEEVTNVVESHVTFYNFSDDDLDRYMDTSESLGKAGSYAIQGEARRFVQAVDGSISNVVGLPLIETADALERMGLPIDVDVRQIEEEEFNRAR